MSLLVGLSRTSDRWLDRLTMGHPTLLGGLTILLPLVAAAAAWTPWWVRLLAAYGAIAMALSLVASGLEVLDGMLRARRERISWWGR